MEETQVRHKAQPPSEPEWAPAGSRGLGAVAEPTGLQLSGAILGPT